MFRPTRLFIAALLFGGIVPPSDAEDEPDGPTRDEAIHALQLAAEFFHGEVSTHGAYVWRYSGDLSYRRGEAVVGPSTAWVQPPGTPSVGEAFLDAHLLTGDPMLLDAARDAAHALCHCQLRSGGWDYSIQFDPDDRSEIAYRDDPEHPSKMKRNKTQLDDDTTQAAVRFLTRIDQALGFEDAEIHEAVDYALDSILAAQHPNGGWYVWWDHFPGPFNEEQYPVLPARFPDDWPRTWPNTWTGRYVLNDDLMEDMLDTLLLADRIYGDARYLDAARKAGDFLILAQLPEPQPAWAQQYNVAMEPDWSRKFEPPAVSGHESQGVIAALLRLYNATDDEKYLDPIGPALDYLRRSALPDGRLARFYELGSNRPLYFTKDYQLTFEDDDLPTHYGFKFDSKLDRLEARYRKLQADGPVFGSLGGSVKPPKLTLELAHRARALIDAMDDRGAWVERADNGSPIIESATFARNLRALASYVAALK